MPVNQCLRNRVKVWRSAVQEILKARNMHSSCQPAELIVNCTWLGSRILGGISDCELFPTRGHNVMVRMRRRIVYIDHMIGGVRDLPGIRKLLANSGKADEHQHSLGSADVGSGSKDLLSAERTPPVTMCDTSNKLLMLGAIIIARYLFVGFQISIIPPRAGSSFPNLRSHYDLY